MISFVHSYQLNSKSVDVDLSQVPNLSDTTKNIFSSLRKSPPPVLHTTGSLADRIVSLEGTKKILKNALTRDRDQKIFAFLMTTLLVAFASGAICSIVFGGVALIPVGVVLASFYLTLSWPLYIDSVKIIEGIENRSPQNSKPWYLFDNSSQPQGYWRRDNCEGYESNRESRIEDVFLSMLGGGLVLPLFEAFTRKSRLERVLKEQQESLQVTLDTFKEKNNSILPVAHQFFKDNSDHLLHQIDNQIQSLDNSLKRLKALSNRTKAGEEDLTKRLQDHQKARNELQSIAAFYRQWNLSE